jgi:fructose-1,6-bisphosphatase/inositol monophosphatase family enzyme
MDTLLPEEYVIPPLMKSLRGEWRRFQKTLRNVRPIGSVAYKLALVSAGLADATFTLTPKHEWDIAAGAAFVSSGGRFRQHAGELVACGATTSRFCSPVFWRADNLCAMNCVPW